MVLSLISSVISDEGHPEAHSDHLSEIPLEGHQTSSPFSTKRYRKTSLMNIDG